MQAPAIANIDSTESTGQNLPLDGVSVMLVEDDLALQEAIIDTLELAGCRVYAEPSAERALEVLAVKAVDMVVTDVNMKGMDGHDLLRTLRQSNPCLPVLLITAYGSIERSVDAIKNGAVDYLIKPFEPKALIDLIVRYATSSVDDALEPVMQDPASSSVFQFAERVAQTDATVLVSGESGTGKEVLARYIHAKSDRSKKPFVALNCAAIPETMLEAMLFGHEKGAFTGAHQSAPGKFEQANGGTLLLDEISEMDIALQSKLLRVLQEREVERLGGRKTIVLDVRVIATTNRDLADCVKNGLFREDLYYRLNVFPLQLPALRHRKADILPLTETLLRDHAAKLRRTHVELSDDAKKALVEYEWPGNVRELDNLLQRAIVLQGSAVIQAGDFFFGNSLGGSSDNSPEQITPLCDSGAVMPSSQGRDNMLETNVKQTEYQIILDVLQQCKGSKKDTATQLGVSPRTLRYKMAKMRELGMLED